MWLPPTCPVSSFTHTPPAGPNPKAALRPAWRPNGVTVNPSGSSSAATSAARAATLIPLAAANESQASHGRNRPNVPVPDESSGGNDDGPATKASAWRRSRAVALGQRQLNGVAMSTCAPHTAHAMPPIAGADVTTRRRHAR